MTVPIINPAIIHVVAIERVINNLLDEAKEQA